MPSVRKLCRTTAPIVHAGGKIDIPKPPPGILGGILVGRSSWSPPFGQPLRNGLDNMNEDERIDLGCGLEHGAFELSEGTSAWIGPGSAGLGDRAEPGPWVALLSYRGSVSVHSAVTAKMPPSLVIVPPNVMTRTLVRRSCPLVGSMTSRAGGSPG